LTDFAIIPIYTYVTKRLVDQHLKGWQNNVMDHHLTRYMYKLKSRKAGATAGQEEEAAGQEEETAGQEEETAGLEEETAELKEETAELEEETAELEEETAAGATAVQEVEQ
jgi:hypothetical protein